MQGSGRTLYVRLAADLTGFTGDMARAGAVVDGFDRRVSTLGQTSGRSAGLLADMGRGAAKAGPAALVVMLGAATSAAVGFEQAMRNVNSIAKLSEGGFAAISAEVLALSRQVPQSAKTLAEGLYEIQSSGFEGADALSVLRASAVAATAGLSDTMTAAKAISGTLNAYGLSAAHAAEVSDVLFKTVEVGSLNFPNLAQNLGDVVNLAAAAGVPIQDVGAAIATMTKGAIVAPEAFTSLTRVIQTLIQPSEALAFTLRQLGYESGEQALETDGLYKVMGRLRGVTGESATAVGELFTEIRANKGALALMSQEGRLYAEAQALVANRTKATGATLDAFEEQMSATSAQARLFRNAITANLIEAGTKALPLLVAGMREVREAGGDMGDVLARVGREVAPLLEQVWRIVTSLGDAVGDLAESAGPTVAVLAALGGSAVLDGLEVLARLIANTTEFLADHEDAVRAVALAYGLIKLGGVAQGFAYLLRLMQQNRAATAALSQGLASWGNALTGQTAAAGASMTSITGSMLKQGAILGAVTLAVWGLTKAWDAAGERAREQQAFADRASASLAESRSDPLRRIAAFKAEIATLGQLSAAASAASGNLDKITSARMPTLTQFDASKFISPGALAEVQHANEHLKALYATAARLQDAPVTVGGISETAEAWATYKSALDDVRGAFDKYAGKLRGDVAAAELDQRARTLSAATELNAAADGASIFDRKLKQVADSGGDVASAMLADANALNAFSDAVGKAIHDQGSLVAKFATGGPVFLSEHAALAAATAEIASVGSYVNEATRGMKAGTDEFRRAASNAIDRRADDLRAAAERAKGTSVKAFIGEFTSDARTFTADLRAAIQAGFDPRFLSELATKGPAQAGPLLRALVAENIGANKTMVNDYERTLSSVEQMTLKFARLNQRALQSESDQAVRDLPTAVKITTALENPRNTTLDAVAKAAGTTVADVKRIADVFGITITAQERMQTAAQTQARHLEQAAFELRHAAMGLREAAELVQPTISASIAPSGGRRAADDIQAGYGVPTRPVTRAAAQPVVVVVPQSKVTNTNTTIERLETQDPAAFARWQAQEERRRELLGL